MTTVNWTEFEAKFEAGAQLEFERLAYLLFCHVHNQSYGIFRYRNHPGCETASIQDGADVVGFQARYYRRELDKHMGDFKDAIDTVRAHDSKTTKIVFFLPVDFTYNTKGKDETLKTETQRKVEEYAAGKGLKLEWFCESNIEKTLAEENLEHWAKHFFTRGKNVVTALCELELQTKDILDSIKSDITVGAHEIKLNRSVEKENVLSALRETIAIVTGTGGVGKTAVIKDLVHDGVFDIAIVLRPHEIVEKLSESGFHHTWGDSVEELKELCSDVANKVLVVDAAEKIPTVSDRDIIFSTIEKFNAAGWKIIFTTRKIYSSQLQASISLKMGSSSQIIEIGVMAIQEVDELLVKYAGNRRVNDVIKDFLRTPFYLDIFLNSQHFFNSTNQLSFIDEIWSEVVGHGDATDQASDVFLDIIKKKVSGDTFYVNAGKYPSDAIKELIRREILVRKKDGSVQIAHDIFEEIGVSRIIEGRYAELSQEQFEKEMISSFAYRRSFRQWLAYRLLDDSDVSRTTISSFCASDNATCRHELMLAMAEDAVCGVFLHKYKEHLLRNAKNLFIDFVNIVYSLKRVFVPGKQENVLPDSKPDGKVWGVLVSFIVENLCDGVLRCDTILPLMRDWCLAYPDSELSKKCAESALTIYRNRDEINKNASVYVKSDDLAELMIASGIKNLELLKTDLDIDINNETGYLSAVASAFTRKLLIDWQNKLSISFIDENPSYIFDLAKRRWLHRRHPREIFSSYSTFEKSETTFGIDTGTYWEYNEPSAFQSPVIRLLYRDCLKTMQFVKEFVNSTTQIAVKKQPDAFLSTSFELPNGERIRQYISSSLWSAYRSGYNYGVPKLYASLHMALEKFLLDLAKDAKLLRSEGFKTLLMSLIKDSVSASITAVVSSVVFAHRNELWEVALVLFSSRAAFECDQARFVMEEEWKAAANIFPWHNNVHSLDRRNAADNDFRRLTLEGLILTYQIERDGADNNLVERVHKIIDSLFKGKTSDQLSDKDQFFLRRVDSRYQDITLWKDDTTGRESVVINPRMTDHLRKKEEEVQRPIKNLGRYAAISKWAEGVIQGSIKTQDNFKRDQEAQGRARQLAELYRSSANTDEYFFLQRRTLILSAFALLSAFDGSLPSSFFKLCRKIVNEGWCRLNSKNYVFQVGDGVVESIMAQPYVMSRDWPWNRKKKIRQFIRQYRNRQRIDILGSDRLCDVAYLATNQFSRKKPVFWRQMLTAYESAYTQKDANYYLDVINILPIERCSDPLVCSYVINGIIPAFTAIYKNDKNHDTEIRRLEPQAQKYSRRLAEWLLHMPEREVNAAVCKLSLMPEVFSNSDFLFALISVADTAKEVTERFWYVWMKLLPLVSQNVHNPIKGRDSDITEMVCTYLLATNFWKLEAHSWVHLTPQSKLYLSEIVDELKDVRYTVEGIIRFMVTIGRDFAFEGFEWLSKVLSSVNFDGYYDADRLNRIKKQISPLLLSVVRDGLQCKGTPEWKAALLQVLDFLVLHHSLEAFYVREQVLA